MTENPLYLAIVKQRPGLQLMVFLLYLFIIIQKQINQHLNKTFKSTSKRHNTISDTSKIFIQRRNEINQWSLLSKIGITSFNYQQQMIDPPQPQFVFNSDYMSLGKLAKIMSHLRNAKLNTVKARFQCPDPSIIRMLKQSFEHKKKIRQPHENMAMLGKKDLTHDEAKKKRFKKTIEFPYKLDIILFVHEYRARLKQLADEYKLYMSWEAETIKVYSDFPISSIFQSQIIEMKHKLKYIVFEDKNFFTKLKYSRIIFERLRNQNISYMNLRKNNCFVLHSSTKRKEQIIQVKNQFAYDAFVLEFESEVFSKRVNRILFRMMVYHLQPFLNQISENYEIKSQVGWKKMGIILHTRDPIFSSEPHQQLGQFLKKLIFVTYYTNDTTQHMMHIRKNKPKQKCLQFMMSDIFIYTCWNTNKTVRPNEVAKIFEKLIQGLSLKTIVRVSFKTVDRSFEEIERVQQLAEKYRLYTEIPFEGDAQDEVIHIKIKSIFNKSQKAESLRKFLQELITGRTCDNQNSTHEQKRKQVQQSVISQSSSSASQQISEQQSQQEIKQVQQPSQKAELQDQRKSLFFQYKFENPIFKIEKYYKINKGKRNRKLEQIIQQKFNILSKVWNTSISIEPQKQGLFEVQQDKNCEIYIKEKQEDPQTLKHEKSISFGGLQIDKEYFLLSKVAQKYIVTHIMEVYSI